MPKCFKFKTEYHDIQNDNPREEVEFRCYLDSVQCRAYTRANRRCQNNTVVGLPYCHAHTKVVYQLAIRPSTSINHDGKGVFAWNASTLAGRVFQPGQVICTFMPPLLNRQQMNARYGDVDQLDSPYGAQITAQVWFDMSCRRHIAAMINHTTPTRANVSFEPTPGRRGPFPIRVVATKNINHGTELLVWFSNTYRVRPLTHRTYDCKYSATWDRDYRGR